LIFIKVNGEHMTSGRITWRQCCFEIYC